MSSDDASSLRDQLEQAIAAQEMLRGAVPDAVIAAAIAALRTQLAELDPSPATDQQRKLVTILFMDVVDSTQLLCDLDPEENMFIMDAALQQLAAPVAAHGGRVTRFMGDGFLAVFGLPRARENDPEMAVRAGLAILEVARQIAGQIETDWQISGFKVRVGANTGLIVAGGVTEAESTFMGAAVNLAARLETTAPPGGFLISQQTYQHIHSLFDVTPGERLPMKGFAELVQVFEVKRARPRAFHLETRGLEEVETRLVGRAGELRSLQSAFESVLQTQTTRFVTVVGEAGIGKSRLLHEFTGWLAQQPFPFALLKSRAGLETMGQPFAMLRDLFAAHFGILDNDPLPVIGERITASFRAAHGMAQNAEMKAHFVGQLLGYDFSDSPDLQGVLAAPRQLHDRAVVYLVEYLRGLAAGQPIVFFLDDLHWADESSLVTLDQLAGELSEQPLLIIALARPSLFERRPDWGRALSERLLAHQRLDLRPLSGEANRELVIELLQKIPKIPPALQKLLVDTSEGNPFYLEELVKMLIADQVIVKAEPHWIVQADRLTAVRIPPTLTGVIQARLDGLSPAERLTLQQASVVGQVFWDGAILAMAQADDSTDPQEHAQDLPQSLDSLRGHEMILPRVTSAFSGTAEYTFKHAILRDVTYESILKRIRPRYHAAVADWLITNTRDLAGEFNGLIARHLEKADRPQEALPYLGQAAKSAIARHAVDEAADFYSRALALVPAADLEVRYALLLGREFVFSLQGDRTAQRQALDALSEIAGILSDAHKLVEVQLRKAWFYFYSSDFPAMQAVAQQAADLIKQPAAQDLAAHVYYALAWTYQVQGDTALAVKYAGDALPLARQLADRRAEGNILNILGLIAVSQGDFMRAAESLELFLEIAREIGDREREITALNNLGAARTAMGDYPAAHAHFSQIITLAGELGDRKAISTALVNLAWVAASSSAWESAVEYSQQGIAMKKEWKQVEAAAEGLVWLGHAWLGLGQPKKAAAAYRESLEIRTALDQPNLAVEAVAGLARVALARQDIASAMQHTAQLMEVLAADPKLSGGWEPLRVYLTCWQVLHAAADPRADQILANAITLLQEQAARLPAGPDRQRFLENIPWHREILALWSASHPDP
ncbi:MAG: ATP-binding protein [Anaerolineales bacterium]